MDSSSTCSTHSITHEKFSCPICKNQFQMVSMFNHLAKKHPSDLKSFFQKKDLQSAIKNKLPLKLTLEWTEECEFDGSLEDKSVSFWACFATYKITTQENRLSNFYKKKQDALAKHLKILQDILEKEFSETNEKFPELHVSAAYEQYREINLLIWYIEKHKFTILEWVEEALPHQKEKFYKLWKQYKGDFKPTPIPATMKKDFEFRKYLLSNEKDYQFLRLLKKIQDFVCKEMFQHSVSDAFVFKSDTRPNGMIEVKDPESRSKSSEFYDEHMAVLQRYRRWNAARSWQGED